MVKEIATACGLAMTAVDGGWSLCAGSAAVVPERTAERHGGRSLHVIPVPPTVIASRRRGNLYRRSQRC